jgi:hypothetical protein
MLDMLLYNYPCYIIILVFPDNWAKCRFYWTPNYLVLCRPYPIVQAPSAVAVSALCGVEAL